MSDQPGCPCSICEENYMNRSDSSGSVGQLADLRRRIAAVLKAADETWDEVSEPYLNQANAVIAELSEHRRLDLVRFATWLLFEEPGEGREEQLVDQYLAETTDG